MRGSPARAARPIDPLKTRAFGKGSFEKPLVNQSPDFSRAQLWMLAPKSRIQKVEAELEKLEDDAEALSLGR